MRRCSECLSQVDNEPLFTPVVWTEPRTLDNIIWGQDHLQLFLLQCFLVVCRKKTQELSNCCPLHRYISPAPSPVAPRGSFLPPGQSQEGLLPFQTERSSDSGEETASAQGGWRSGTAAPGAPCAMTPGAWQRPRWCVSSWAVARPWKPCGPRHLALEMGASGWMGCSAGAGNPPCGTVLQSPGGRTIANTRRMLV